MPKLDIGIQTWDGGKGREIGRSSQTRSKPDTAEKGSLIHDAFACSILYKKILTKQRCTNLRGGCAADCEQRNTIGNGIRQHIEQVSNSRFQSVTGW